MWSNKRFKQSVPQLFKGPGIYTQFSAQLGSPIQHKYLVQRTLTGFRFENNNNIIRHIHAEALHWRKTADA